MSRKRFIKLLMSCDKQRNEAQTIAKLYNARGLSYKNAYTDFLLLHGFEISFKKLSKSVNAFGENFKKAAAQAQKLAAALNAQNHLEVGV